MLCREKDIVIFVGGAFSLDMSICVSTSELRVRLARLETSLSHPVKYGLAVSGQCFFCGTLMLFLSCFDFICSLLII